MHHYTFESKTDAVWPAGPDHFAEVLGSVYRLYTLQIQCASGRELKVLADRQWVQVEGHADDCEEFTAWLMADGHVPLDTTVLRVPVARTETEGNVR